jgi:hypothetical protein
VANVIPPDKGEDICEVWDIADSPGKIRQRRNDPYRIVVRMMLSGELHRNILKERQRQQNEHRQ